MAIQNGLSSIVLVAVAAPTGDVILLNPTTGRALIQTGILSATTGVNDTIELFVSTDASSATAERIEKILVKPDETADPISLINLVIPEGSFLIAKAITGDLVTAYLTYTQYSGED